MEILFRGVLVVSGITFMWMFLDASGFNWFGQVSMICAVLAIAGMAWIASRWRKSYSLSRHLMSALCVLAGVIIAAAIPLSLSSGLLSEWPDQSTASE